MSAEMESLHRVYEKVLREDLITLHSVLHDQLQRGGVPTCRDELTTLDVKLRTTTAKLQSTLAKVILLHVHAPPSGEK